MEGWVKILLVAGFFLFRFILSANKKKSKDRPKANTPKPARQEARPKSIDDIFGDFMKEINKDNTTEHGSKPKPVAMKKDTHKAEEDTEKLDWQEVYKPKANKLNVESNYKNISNSDRKDSPLEAAEVQKVKAENEVEIDLKQAIIYQAVLERKYFSI